MKRSAARRRAAIQAKPLLGGAGAARFAHDPGPGKLLTGSVVATFGSGVGGGGTPTGVADGNAWLDDNTGVNHLLKRVYYSNTAPNSGVWSRTTIQNYRNAGKIPSIAWHMSASAANIAAFASGSMDANVTAEAQWAASVDYPIWTAFMHEPEDNFTADADAANYRAAYRRYRQIFRDAGASKVVFVGVAWQANWSFRTSGGGEAVRGPWWKWDPDWKGTLSGAGGTRPNASDWYTGSESALDIMSMDTYTPTLGATAYHEFSVDAGDTLDRMISDGRPILPWVVLEMGTFTAGSGMPADGWTGFYQRAFRFMRDNEGVGFVTYNAASTNFINADTFAERFAGYQDALASEAAYLVTTRPPDEGVGGPGARVTFVGASVAAGNLTTISPTIPTGAQAGDVGLLFWTHASASTISADPTAQGWTLAANNAGGAGAMSAKIYYKVLTGGDANPSATSSLARHAQALVVYRGVNATNPLDGTPAVDTSHTAGLTHNNPAYTTTNANCVIITSVHERATNIDTDFTAPAGYTERADTLAQGVGTGGAVTAVADNGLALVSAGVATTPPVWTGDDPNATGGTGNIVTYTLALRAA